MEAKKPGLRLTRRKGEIVVIDLPDGESVVIEVETTRGRQTRLRIAAPQSCRIYRAELLEPT